MKPKTKDMGELILNTEIVQIYLKNEEYCIYIRMSRGGTIEHEPMPGNVQGLVNALQLATEVCAGKFFPRGVVETGSPAISVEPKLLNATKRD